MSEELPDYEQRLRDMGLPTLAETREYRETAGWEPYEVYLEKICFHHSGRKFDQHNMRQDWLDKQIEPNRLLREAAYLLGLKHRDTESYTEEEQKELEEELYNKFMLTMFNVLNPPGDSNAPWPMDEDV